MLHRTPPTAEQVATNRSNLSWVSSYASTFVIIPCLDGFDLEVQTYERKDQRFQILYQVVEDTQAFWVLGLVNIDQRADLGGFERNVLASYPDLELLPPVLVLLRPLRIVFPVQRVLEVNLTRGSSNVLQNFTLLDNDLDLVDEKRAHTHYAVNRQFNV